jgi:hypothetical protein
MNEAIKKAIEGGYKDPRLKRDDTIRNPERAANNVWYSSEAFVMLDPLFWQALGKAMGWESKVFICPGHKKEEMWFYHWHRFIDHLAEGKDADSFFKELLK